MQQLRAVISAGDTTCGQRAVYQLGMAGIPIYNVSDATVHCCRTCFVPSSLPLVLPSFILLSHFSSPPSSIPPPLPHPLTSLCLSYCLPPSFPLPPPPKVNNACSTGSSALLLAQQLVRGGSAQCVMALGFEKMERGSLTAKVLLLCSLFC